MLAVADFFKAGRVEINPGEQDIDIVSCPRRWLSQPRRVAPAAASKPTWDSCRLTILPIGLQRG